MRQRTNNGSVVTPAPTAIVSTMMIELWPIERPQPYKKNARKWTGEAIHKLAASIREFGWRQPIVVDRNDVIVIGHLRLAAARYLGLKEVPVHVAADLTPEQIKGLRIADNRTHEEAEWDFQTLAIDLIDLKLADFNLDLTGFEIDEVVGAVFGSNGKKKSVKKDLNMNDDLEFKIVVDCASETHQAEVLNRFKAEGFKCRALIS